MHSLMAGDSVLVLAVLAFTAFLLLAEGIYLLWRSSKGAEAVRLRTRLRSLAVSTDRSAQAQVLKLRMLSDLPAVERILQQMPRMRANSSIDSLKDSILSLENAA